MKIFKTHSFANFRKHINIDVSSQCLKDNSKCSATRELTRKIPVWNNDGFQPKKLQAKNTCKFPFIYKKVRYDSCTKKKKKNFWCATTVDAKNKKISWGYCNDLCPTDESWNIKIVVGILVGVLIIVALFITGYICIKKQKVVKRKKTMVTQENAEASVRYSLDPTISKNRAMINSEMILNDQATLLTYIGDHEIEVLVSRCKKLNSLFLRQTNIGNDSLMNIIENLQDTLVNLCVEHTSIDFGCSGRVLAFWLKRRVTFWLKCLL